MNKAKIAAVVLATGVSVSNVTGASAQTNDADRAALTYSSLMPALSARFPGANTITIVVGDNAQGYILTGGKFAQMSSLEVWEVLRLFADKRQLLMVSTEKE